MRTLLGNIVNKLKVGDYLEIDSNGCIYKSYIIKIDSSFYHKNSMRIWGNWSDRKNITHFLSDSTTAYAIKHTIAQPKIYGIARFCMKVNHVT